MVKILVLGNDKRSKYLYEIINEQASISASYYKTHQFNLDENSKSFDIIILPIPTKIDANGYLIDSQLRLVDVYNYFKEKKIIYYAVGKFPSIGLDAKYDLSINEKYLDENALLTAKALFKIAQFDDKSKINKTALVVGMGRIGRYLAKLFDNTNIKYCIASSSLKEYKEYKNCIKIINYDELHSEYSKYDFIINTAPHNYFDIELLNKYSGNYYELASKPYGFCYDINSLPKSVTMCPALPGKYYPEKAAQIIYESIKHIIFEVAHNE